MAAPLVEKSRWATMALKTELGESGTDDSDDDRMSAVP